MYVFNLPYYLFTERRNVGSCVQTISDRKVIALILFSYIIELLIKIKMKMYVVYQGI